MTLNFTCPSCKGHKLEEIQKEAVITSEIVEVHPDYLDVGEQTNECGDIDRFQCVDCGWVLTLMPNPDMKPGKLTLPRPVRDYGVLFRWLEEQASLSSP